MLQLLQKGRSKLVEASAGEQVFPDAGKKWLVQGGMITHINGTSSYARFFIGSTSLLQFYVISTASGGKYPMFNHYGVNVNGNIPPNGIFMDSNVNVQIEGGSGVKVELLVWEIDEHE